LRFSVCNELFQPLSFADACAAIRQIGYRGIEIAPFTLAQDPANLTRDDRLLVRDTIASHQLEFVGLHWLLVSPQGLHATTSDKSLRAKTWTFIAGLVDLCADLVPAQNDQPAVMVFGSPKQRSAENEISPAQAVHILTEELARIAPHAEQRNVQLLLESLSPDQTNVVNTLEESVRIVKQVNSPAIKTMFDVHNAAQEKLTHLALIRRFFPYIRHLHVNEFDGREPGTGSYDFPALLSTLTELHYSGWVSLEVFDMSRGASAIASDALKYLENALQPQTQL
jgi:D-psicose/D-tagatose/L-ribulose 3-epimerase